MVTDLLTAHITTLQFPTLAQSSIHTLISEDAALYALPNPYLSCSSFWSLRQLPPRQLLQSFCSQTSRNLTLLLYLYQSCPYCYPWTPHLRNRVQESSKQGLLGLLLHRDGPPTTSDVHAKANHRLELPQWRIQQPSHSRRPREERRTTLDHQVSVRSEHRFRKRQIPWARP